jgi:hypothetical protein
MAPEQEPPRLRVGCYCGEWVPVKASEAGCAVKCPCGRRVEVPLLEEFRDHSDLLSSTTVESRILRLVAEKELPRIGLCEKCGDRNSREVVSAKLDCERATVSHHGGLSFLYIPFLFWMFWQEEERIEIRGHDTRVPAPISLCRPCHVRLCERPGSLKIGIGLAILFISFGILVGYFNVAAGIGVVATGLLGSFAGVSVGRYVAFRARERALKNLLSQVPVYRQMLVTYPDATVIFPECD